MTSSNELPWTRSEVHDNQPFVVIYKRGELKFDVAKEKGLMNSRFGDFEYDQVIGKPFGSQWVSKTEKPKKGHRRKKPKMVDGKEEEIDKVLDEKKLGRLHVLPCTPELWCRSLLHRTQIVYALDASLICFHLDLLPGSVVAESGTGSGSLSLAMARSVAPNGHVYTYEYNESRVTAAKNDFKLLGIDNMVTIQKSDAEAEGFIGVDGKCNAVFLDLPQPWKTLHNCIKALRTDVETRLCSFSPCIEQVQRTCEKLDELGFFQIRTFECVFRELETYRVQERIPKMWEDHTKASDLKTTFIPANESGSTCLVSEMATHTGYLTFCSRFPPVAGTDSKSQNQNRLNKLMGLDVSKSMVGVSISDANYQFASPLTYFKRTSNDQKLYNDIKQVIQNRGPFSGIVVGWPLDLSNNMGDSCFTVGSFVEPLYYQIRIPITLYDETGTTVEARKMLGKRKNKGEYDVAAATFILQSFIDEQLERTV